MRDYIRRFSDMRLKILKISHDEAISTFIKGLCFHEVLRNKLLRKRPTTMAELLATAKNYADADDAEKLIREDARGPDQPPRWDDSRGRFDNRNHRRPDNRDHREGWIGGVTIAMTSGACALVTTTTRFIRSSAPMGGETTRKITTRR